MRRLGTGARLPNPGNAQSVIDLLKVNADLARMGNLLKLAIDEDQSITVLDLVDQIRATQALLKTKIKEL